MLYEFECPTCGTRIAEQHPMRSAPPLGRESAETCPRGCATRPVRVLSAVGSNREYQAYTNKYPYVTRRHGRLVGADAIDSTTGHAIIESRQHEREVAAMNGLVRE